MRDAGNQNSAWVIFLKALSVKFDRIFLQGMETDTCRLNPKGLLLVIFYLGFAKYETSGT